MISDDKLKELKEDKFKMFYTDEDGKKHYIKGTWKKMFNFRWDHALFIVLIIVSALMYMHDTAECREIVTAYNNGSLAVQYNQQIGNPTINPLLLNFTNDIETT